MQTISFRRDVIRSVILSAGSTIFAVDFVKKDGSLRTLQIQLPAIKSRLVGDSASDSAKRATETRKANNPNLMAVWSIDAKGIRSINLDTVTAVNLRGVRTTWSLPDDITLS